MREGSLPNSGIAEDKALIHMPSLLHSRSQNVGVAKLLLLGAIGFTVGAAVGYIFMGTIHAVRLCDTSWFAASLLLRLELGNGNAGGSMSCVADKFAEEEAVDCVEPPS